MQYFAKLDGQNIVTVVHIVEDVNCPGESYIERETSGVPFCIKEFGEGRYLVTSRENEYRQRYAGIGMSYDDGLDKFLFPKPYPSWLLDENFDWVAPKAYPTDGKTYLWDEPTKKWVEQVTE